MSLSKLFSYLEIEYKGGAGSGNFGHAGVPGHLGGSAPSHPTYSTFQEAYGDVNYGKSFGDGYFILNNGQIDKTNPNEAHDTYLYKLSKSNPQLVESLYGIKKDEDSYNMLHSVLKNGAVRVRIMSSNNVNLQVGALDNESLKGIKKNLLEGKIFYKPGSKLFIEDIKGNHIGDYVTPEEIFDSKSLAHLQKMSTLKQIEKIKCAMTA